MASFVTNIKAIYSVLVENRVTVDYLLEHQLTRPSLSIRMKSNIDFQLLLSLARWEFEYPSISRLLWSLQMIPRCLKSFRYCKIVFTVFLCWCPGFFARRLAMKLANAISGLVSIIENMRELVISWYRFFSEVLASLSVVCSRIANSSIEVLTICALSRLNLLRTLSMYTGWDSVIFWFSQLRCTSRLKWKLTGPMSIIGKARVSYDLTRSIIPLLLSAIILISLTNVLMTGLSRLALMTKML